MGFHLISRNQIMKPDPFPMKIHNDPQILNIKTFMCDLMEGRYQTLKLKILQCLNSKQFWRINWSDWSIFTFENAFLNLYRAKGKVILFVIYTCTNVLKKHLLLIKAEGATLKNRNEFYNTCRHRKTLLLENTWATNFVLVQNYSLTGCVPIHFFVIADDCGICPIWNKFVQII